MRRQAWHKACAPTLVGLGAGRGPKRRPEEASSLPRPPSPARHPPPQLSAARLALSLALGSLFTRHRALCLWRLGWGYRQLT